MALEPNKWFFTRSCWDQWLSSSPSPPSFIRDTWMMIGTREQLGGGFQYFSDGLVQPPTRQGFTEGFGLWVHLFFQSYPLVVPKIAGISTFSIGVIHLNEGDPFYSLCYVSSPECSVFFGRYSE